MPMRPLQEWLGHRDFVTTLIHADYPPGGREVELSNAAFGTEFVPDDSGESAEVPDLQAVSED